jgi:phosphoserine phosphatase
VGDHVNDIPAMRIAGLAVAANPKERQVAEAAAFVIESFLELPPLLDSWCEAASAHSGSA